jgi:hypothetical protein
MGIFTRPPGKNPLWFDGNSPNFPVYGRDLQGVDQKAHQANTFFQEQRRDRNKGELSLVMYDWARESKMHQAISNAKHKGNKGGSTNTRDNMRGC